MMSQTETKLLKKISESQLVSKDELKQFLRSNGVENDAVLDSVLQSLVTKGFVNVLNGVGSTCFVITNKGNNMF